MILITYSFTWMVGIICAPLLLWYALVHVFQAFIYIEKSFFFFLKNNNKTDKILWSFLLQKYGCAFDICSCPVSCTTSISQKSQCVGTAEACRPYKSWWLWCLLHDCHLGWIDWLNFGVSYEEEVKLCQL